mgnify:CR=1 FL=1
MNILILGSGGREHTFAWKIAQSKLCDNLFVAPGNSGTEKIATNVNIGVNDFEAIKKLVQTENIKMVVVGPEDPLVNGIHDFFLNNEALKDVIVVGPQQEAAKLEGSKEFAKEFMYRHNIPTAAYESFTKETVEKGYAFLETLNAPYVLKADGLAAGKGVVILNDISEAKAELKSMLVHAKFGQASTKVVIEEFKETCLNEPYGDVWHHIADLAYKVHPYRWPTIGKIPKHVEDATLEDVQDFYDKYYNPNNAILVVAGNVKTDDIKKLTEEWFGEIPPENQGENHEDGHVNFWAPKKYEAFIKNNNFDIIDFKMESSVEYPWVILLFLL